MLIRNSWLMLLLAVAAGCAADESYPLTQKDFDEYFLGQFQSVRQEFEGIVDSKSEREAFANLNRTVADFKLSYQVELFCADGEAIAIPEPVESLNVLEGASADITLMTHASTATLTFRHEFIDPENFVFLRIGISRP